MADGVRVVQYGSLKNIDGAQRITQMRIPTPLPVYCYNIIIA
jgi:hypothetical protein